MTEANNRHNDFIEKLTEIVELNISDEQFGVSELSEAVGMSRSNVLRKVKKATGLSVSLFIRNIRLKHAHELLQQSDVSVSEVCYAVGFGSTSYFTKCYKEHYGYPPGETIAQLQSETSSEEKQNISKKFAITGLLVIVAAALIYFGFTFTEEPTNKEAIPYGKSIAVLPFVNNSGDSSNTYFVNGLMVSVLNDLQKIEDLKVISRTSVEKFRNNTKTIPEIGEELKVSYVVEGSGQKVNDKILLSIQLLDAANDEPIWSQRFERDAVDVFDLQKEISNIITKRIEVMVTPEEIARINKQPTQDLIAYDYFLQGYDELHFGNRESLEKSISSFTKAVEQDTTFARAYAGIAMAYYYLDIFQRDKLHQEDLNFYADKALFYDDELAQSLIAKSMYYMSLGNCKSAIPFLKKALKYNPNSAIALNFLSDIYATCVPDAGNYLRHTLKGLEVNIAANDSSSTSFNYMHLSNALVQNGFVQEAEHYINKSLSYNPNNLFSDYVKAYILYARDKDLPKTRERLRATLDKDTTRLDVLQELAKVCYYLRDFESSYAYFKAFDDARERYNMDIFKNIDGEIAFVYAQMGKVRESQEFMVRFKEYVDNNPTVAKNVELAMYYSYIGETEKALDHFEIYANDEDVHYWSLLFLDREPLLDNIRTTPRFKEIFETMRSKFWQRHRRLKEEISPIELL
ncbi:helix-turn-helix domain-containing protein [Psychroserpens sp.]|uniref:helix-turn-helix domain-containing protein n=1 Tax=Psychroserpens sp. TaxID=2020870 RepID=UPI001AFFBDEE|nr:helix-turn-helix domain-containing protein [Psychroserpens sp.]MBO6606093.1 helix-turn-helix domain-containing protein [Psychroserpens sp.]MBO6631313.1 helix-turn-helix domain-containing protein [Psychroserpens sp.]MBO6652536.1 helix-turn-helix domain-containing protein [Psychroserpens sp.]MBO6681692.1 helix-turn-helix domain-containing protein [Psychroserpens sp.]MBO6749467.1 helix-turn-helix domain-containing protein [Psychroserpens sp.]